MRRLDRFGREITSYGEPVVVHIQPISVLDKNRDEYFAFIYNEFLLGPSETPYLDTANRLLDLGYDGRRKLLMRRRGVDVNQLSYTIFDAARLEVENQSNPPFPYPLQQDGPGIVP